MVVSAVRVLPGFRYSYSYVDLTVVRGVSRLLLFTLSSGTLVVGVWAAHIGLVF